MLFGEQVLRPPWGLLIPAGLPGAVTVSIPIHRSYDGKRLGHNGVIENFGTLKRFLSSKGISFSSETDSEVLCNLIAYHYSELPEDEDRFIDAVRLALPKCRGAYGIAVLCLDYPEVMIGARRGSPLVVGLGDEANFIASELPPSWACQGGRLPQRRGEAVLDSEHPDYHQRAKSQAVTHPLDQILEESNWGISIPTWKRDFRATNRSGEHPAG